MPSPHTPPDEKQSGEQSQIPKSGKDQRDCKIGIT